MRGTYLKQREDQWHQPGGGDKASFKEKPSNRQELETGSRLRTLSCSQDQFPKQDVCMHTSSYTTSLKKIKVCLVMFVSALSRTESLGNKVEVWNLTGWTARPKEWGMLSVCVPAKCWGTEQKETPQKIQSCLFRKGIPSNQRQH